MARIIVSGELVRYPLGGMNHAFLPWLVGLQQLGHDVYFVERAYWPQSCYDVEKGVKTDDCSYGLKITSEILARYDFQERWCFVNNDGQYYGLSREHVLEVFRTADLFLELDWNTWVEESAQIPVRVLIESEPGWSQMNRPEQMKL